MKKLGIDVRWKNVQEKESTPCVAIWGVPSTFCEEGIKHTLLRAMEIEEDRMRDKGLQDFKFIGEPMPDINIFHRNLRDGRLPLEQYKALTMNNIDGFKEHGCKVLMIEISPAARLRLGPIIEHMHKCGSLKKGLGKRAHATQVQQGKQLAGNSITKQTNKRAQIKYVNHLSYVNIPEVATMEKRVELRRLDGKDSSPRFTCLRLELLKLE